MRLIGLTGGIASGKSSVTKVMQEQGCEVLCCDVAARQVVEQGCPGYNKVVKEFGREILLPNGEMDREKLGEVVWGHPEKRALLNKCIHPEIAKVIRRNIIWHFIKGTQLLVIDIPLLFENCNLTPYLHAVVVVYCSEEQQIERLMLRSDLEEEDAKSRLTCQMNIEEKRKKADHVILNTGLFCETERQIQELVPVLQSGIIPIRNILLALLVMLFAGLTYLY